VPRVLSLSPDGRRVAQAPAAELSQLRRGSLGFIRRGTPLADASPIPLAPPSPDTACCDILARFSIGGGGSICGGVIDELSATAPAAAAVGIWCAPAAPGAAGLLLLFWFATASLAAAHEGSLAAAAAAAAAAHAAAQPPPDDESDDYPDGPPSYDSSPHASYDATPTVGVPEVTVELRALFDHSAVELFTTERGSASGLALSTRHYAGSRRHGGATGGIHLVALGGDAAVLSGNAWAMQGCWGEREPACAPEAAARSVAEAEAALRRWSV
jgi:hypothetical protein